MLELIRTTTLSIIVNAKTVSNRQGNTYCADGSDRFPLEMYGIHSVLS